MSMQGIHITSPNEGGGGGPAGPVTIYDVIANRPDPTSVLPGTEFTATDIGLTYRSDGTSWFLKDLSDTPLEDITITYNANEDINTVVSASRTLQFTYDAGGNMLTVTNVTEGWTKTFGYVEGNLVSVTIS